MHDSQLFEDILIAPSRSFNPREHRQRHQGGFILNTAVHVNTQYDDAVTCARECSVDNCGKEHTQEHGSQ